MIVSRDQVVAWRRALTLEDGSSPPNEIVFRCIALADEPDLVIAASPPVPAGTAWEVIACSGRTILVLSAMSADTRWNFRFMSDFGSHGAPVRAEITATVYPLSAVVSVSALPHGDEYLFHGGGEPGDDDTHLRAGWSLALNNGPEVVLGPQFRYGAWREKDAVARQIVTRVMDSWV